MPALVFILPLSGARTYRGKYPNRARDVSLGACGLHVELNDGTRLWTARPRDHFAGVPHHGHNMAGFRDKAIAMTDSQYAELIAAAELLQTRGQIAGHGRRADLESRVRNMVNRIGAEIVSSDETVQREAANAMGMTSETVSASPVQIGTVKTIDLTPTWSGILPTLLLLLQSGNMEGKATAAAELRKMAKLADNRNTAATALGNLTTAANETAHCVPAGMARDELDAAIAAGFAALALEA